MFSARSFRGGRGRRGAVLIDERSVAAARAPVMADLVAALGLSPIPVIVGDGRASPPGSYPTSTSIGDGRRAATEGRPYNAGTTHNPLQRHHEW